MTGVMKGMLTGHYQSNLMKYVELQVQISGFSCLQVNKGGSFQVN